ncbi:hypothetical protein BDZ45DRAFT_561386, partial [Acephala macrosclerotiorum]
HNPTCGRQNSKCLYSQISPAAVYTEPLNLRAWTLQEALLPKHVLRFNTKESGWECSK